MVDTFEGMTHPLAVCNAPEETADKGKMRQLLPELVHETHGRSSLHGSGLFTVSGSISGRKMFRPYCC
jgi:hypothetical protein